MSSPAKPDSTPKPSQKYTAYIGPFVHCLSLKALQVCENGVILVNGAGKIVFTANALTPAQMAKQCALFLQQGDEDVSLTIYDARKGDGKIRFFFPGLVDTHIHASQYPNSGLFGSTTLIDWLNKYTYPTESSFSKPSVANTIYNRIVSRTLSHGTTTASYFGTIHAQATNRLSDICLARGQRAFIGKVCMDRASQAPSYYIEPSVFQSICATKETIEHIKKIDPHYKLVTPIVTPRFAVSCTKELLEEMGKLAEDENLPIQTHMDENEDEIALVVNKLFPGSPSYADVYEKTGILTDRTVLAHAVHTKEEELKLLKKRGSKISHCPVSNSALGSGLAKVRTMLEMDIEVGLGTDVSGGYSSSVLEAARQAVLVSKLVAQSEGDPKFRLSVEEVLYLATLGGAKVMGLGHLIGTFEVGKDWDAICVELSLVEDAGSHGGGEELNGNIVEDGNVDIFQNETGWSDIIAKWLFTGDDRNNKAVWVKGRMVHEKSPPQGGDV